MTPSERQTAHWASEAVHRLTGDQPLRVEPLRGTAIESAVARVHLAGEPTYVVKRFPPGSFEAARLLAGLPAGGVFATVVGEDPASRAICFADAGEVTMADALRERAPADRAGLASIYVERVVAAHRVLGALGTVPACPPTIAALLGFQPLSPPQAASHSVTRQLLILADTRREAVPARVVDEAIAAEKQTAARLRDCRDNRRWILADSNPFNLVRGRDGEWRWVDVGAVPGLPDTNLMTLAGAAFGLPEVDVVRLVAAAGGALDGPGVSTANGLFSLLTMLDTWWGMVTSARDGAAPYGWGYADAEAFSLNLARQSLAVGWPQGHGWLGLIAWLQARAPHDAPDEPASRGSPATGGGSDG